MKSMKIITSALIVCALVSCAGSPGSGAGKVDAAASSDASGDSTYNGDASLSYTLNGRHFAIKDWLRTGGKSMVALYINDLKNDPASGTVLVNLTNYLTQDVIKFKVNGSGSSAILHYTPSFNNTKLQGEYMYKYNNYYADNATVNITANDATHVAGTFSGTFVSDKKGSITLTDGKFDIPYSSLPKQPN